MSNQSAVEQEILELINRARLNPAAEAARDGIDLNEGLMAGTISAASKQPLAMNETLLTIARAHDQDMLTNNYFAHTDLSGHTPDQRMTAAGYPFTWWGENIAWSGTTGTVTQQMSVDLEEQLFVDAGVNGRGHRVNLLNDNFQEVGDGVLNGSFMGFNATMITQDFGATSTPQLLTGVVFSDTVIADKFYSIGEGRGNVTVAVAGGSSTTTGSAGGYSEAIAAGTQTVTFSGGDETTPAVLTATITAGTNAKIDLMGQSAIRTSVSVTAVSGISTIIGLGTIGLTLTGGAEADTISGGTGNDTLNGGGGFDTADYSDLASTAASLVQVSAGDWTITSADGTDTLLSIEAVTFAAAAATLVGGGLLVTFTGTGNSATLSNTKGNNDFIYGANGTVILNGAQANVFGQHTISFATGTTGNVVDLASTTGHWDTVNGSNGTVYLNNALALVTGGADIVNFQGSVGNVVDLAGTAGHWDTVNGSNGTIYLDGALALVVGGTDTVNMRGSAGNVVDLTGTAGHWDTVNGSNGTIYLDGALALVVGGTDTVNMRGSAGNVVDLTGTAGHWDTVNGSNGTIYLDGALALVVGGADTVNMRGSAGNVVDLASTAGHADTVNGSNGTIYLTNAQAVVVGSHDTVIMSGTSTASQSGSSNAFVFKPAFGQDILTDFSSHLTGTNDDTITLPSSEFGSFANMMLHDAVQSGSNVILTSATTPTDHLTLDNITIATINAHAGDFKFA